MKNAHQKIVEACREASGALARFADRKKDSVTREELRQLRAALTSSANKLENVETILKQHEPMPIV